MDLENQLVSAIFQVDPNAKYTSSRTELLIRCCYCGDSKDISHAHFYIKIKLDKGDVPVFYCHKCQVSGVVNSEFLRNLSIYDMELSGALTKYNKIAAKNPINKNKFIAKVKLLNPLANDIDQSYKKLEYVNERIGMSLNLSDLLKLKICLNLYDILDANKIDKLSVSDGMGKLLDIDFVGFISIDNKYITFRNIGKKFSGRYLKYNTFQALDNTKSFYSIPNKIDMMSTETIEINIAEGPFDIISVFYNIKNCELSHNLYVANCGSGYLNTIKYFIKLGFIDCKINIYSDTDKDINFYRYIKKQLKEILVNDITVYYNDFEGEKDFGVPYSKMKIIKVTV